MSTKPKADVDTQQNEDTETIQVYRCQCGMTCKDMELFVDHVSDDHNVLDIAVKAMIADTLEVDA